MARSAGDTAPLGMLLIEHGVLEEHQVDGALVAQQQRGGRLGEILLERGLVSRPLLARVLARQAGVVLEAEGGFGSGLRELIERRHLARSGGRGRQAGWTDALMDADALDAAPSNSGRALGERRMQPDRRKGDRRRPQARAPRSAARATWSSGAGEQ